MSHSELSSGGAKFELKADSEQSPGMVGDGLELKYLIPTVSSIARQTRGFL